MSNRVNSQYDTNRVGIAARYLADLDKSFDQADDNAVEGTDLDAHAKFQEQLDALCNYQPLAALEQSRQTILKSARDLWDEIGSVDQTLVDAGKDVVPGEQWQQDYERAGQAIDVGHDWALDRFHTITGFKPDDENVDRRVTDLDLTSDEVKTLVELMEMEKPDDEAPQSNLSNFIDGVEHGVRRLTDRMEYDDFQAQMLLDLRQAGLVAEDEGHDVEGDGNIEDDDDEDEA